MRHLRRADPGTVPIVRRPVELGTLREAALIVEDVRLGGESALRQHAQRLGDLEPGDEIVLDRSRIEQTLESLPGDTRGVLERVAGRIRSFAQAQRQSLNDVDIEVSGGRAGHRWIPVSSAGAYAPGGRYPLPSSVLMTVIPARGG
ncbi:MAG: histidinol dehydrogenase, partial [Acidimicrobiia bacterium]